MVAKTVEGEIGILAAREPVLAVLSDGTVRVETIDGTTMVVAFHGGFFSVDSDRVAIVVVAAEAAADIDVVRAEAALERVKAVCLDSPEEVAAVCLAETCLRVAVTHIR
ncbi:MAG: F0F1 ATP synthase subunit epsilon [Actinobacteria bacterium]|uniref:Unannotated protein n=1 Tax=freshwater metagenome TaxID=449393 RepID=A0A6J7J4U4_9ZZZZ|nr:F0F1 ATP synthase subunit epsilon [Actinomycetota bacterium]